MARKLQAQELNFINGESFLMLKNMILLIGILFFMFLSKDFIGTLSLGMNLKSGALVLAGTLISVLLAFPFKMLKELIRSLGEAFKPDSIDFAALVQQIQSLSRLRRVFSPRELGAKLKHIDNIFLRKGLDLIIDEYDRYEINHIMENEISLYMDRKKSLVHILNTLTKLAPVFGFIGTIIGLINVLGNVGDVAEISKGMSTALLTTFYGLVFANFLFLPMANKLTEHMKKEAVMLNIVMQGITDICELRNPVIISHRLESCLAIAAPLESVAPRKHKKEDKSNRRDLKAKLRARAQNA